MIMPHLFYCLTSQAQGSCRTQEVVQSEYIQASKVLERKAKVLCYCDSLINQNNLGWASL